MKIAYYLFIIFFVLGVSSCGIFKKKSTPKNGSKKEVSKKTSILEKYSEKVGEEVKNEKLYTTIDEWMGVPYRYGGKSKSGIDCSNFTCHVLREVFSYPSNFYFPSSKLAEQGEIINLKQAREGDLVFFSINSNSKISHVGIFLANKKFVHASTSKGVIINSLDEEYYKKRFAFIKRIQ